MRRVLVTAASQCREALPWTHPFNNLVKGLTNNTVSRRHALKLVGAAILSAILAPLFPRRALTQSVENRWELSDVEYVPTSTQRICQLTGNFDPEGLPHINYTGQWGIEGTDFGVTVEHQEKLFILFGDVPSAHDADPIVYTTGWVWLAWCHSRQR